MCTKVRKATHWKLDLGRNFYNRNIDHAKFERTNKKYIPENILIFLSPRRGNKMIHMILNEKVDLSDRTCAQSQL